MASRADLIRVGSKVKVKVGKTWHPAKVVAISDVLVEVDRLDDDTHHTIYAHRDGLRVIAPTPQRVRGKVNGDH